MVSKKRGMGQDFDPLIGSLEDFNVEYLTARLKWLFLGLLNSEFDSVPRTGFGLI